MVDIIDQWSTFAIIDYPGHPEKGDQKSKCFVTSTSTMLFVNRSTTWDLGGSLFPTMLFFAV